MIGRCCGCVKPLSQRNELPPSHQTAIQSLAFSSDGFWLASGAHDEDVDKWGYAPDESLYPTVFLWDLQTKKVIALVCSQWF